MWRRSPSSSELFGDDHPMVICPTARWRRWRSFPPQDVRGFYHEFYRPESAIAAVVGDIEPDEVVKALNEELAALKGCGAAPEAAAASSNSRRARMSRRSTATSARPTSCWVSTVSPAPIPITTSSR